MLFRHMVTTAAILGAFTVLGVTVVGVTHKNTREGIATAEREALMRSLDAVVSHDRYDNDLFADSIEISSAEYLGTTQPVTLYRARKAGAPVAAMFSAIAPDGYSGAIRFIIGINADGTLSGVRIISHRETPGLGDYIEIERSNWIRVFDGRSLTDPEASRWKVKKDGGVFDQNTGATITPRALVKAVHKCLLYFAGHREEIFNQPANSKLGLEENDHE